MTNTATEMATLFAVLVTMKKKDEPLVSLPEITSAYPWPTFFLMATSFYFGSILTVPTTNIPILLELLLSSFLQGLSYIPFTLAVMMFALVATNLMNSIVVGIIVAPIIATVAIAYGFAVTPVIALLFFVLMSALLTPAAGVQGALLFGNKEWLPGKNAFFYAMFFVITITIVTLVVGVPLAQVLFYSAYEFLCGW